MSDVGLNGGLFPFTVWLTAEDEMRLDKLSKKFDREYSDIVSASLEFYEAALNAIEAGLNNHTSMEFVEATE